MTTPISAGSSPDFSRAVAIGADDKIVVAGVTFNGANNDFALARYFGGSDDVAPRVSTPTHTLQGATTPGTSTVPVKLSWSATDAQGDVTRYELRRSTDGETYANVALPTLTTTTITQSLTPNHTYRCRVKAQDDNGNTSFFKYGPASR